MDSSRNKSLTKSKPKKIIAGIKLPPIENCDSDIKTIIEVDPSFYSLIEGRPIRPDSSIYNYKQHIKDVAIKRTLHGFLVDEILRIDKDMKIETEIYQTASKHFDEYQKSFDKFLAYDNNKTITVMKNSDALSKDLATQTEEHKKINHEMATLKSKLQYTEDTLVILLSFQKFLYKASPFLWRNLQNINIDEVRPQIFIMTSDLFNNIDIESLKNKLNQLPPTNLYFENTDQLFSAFALLEQQNLNYLLVTEKLTSEKNKFLKALESFKKLLQEELDYIKEQISETERNIKVYEAREKEVKEVFYTILEQKIRFLVSSDMALQIFNYIEFAYEKLIAPNNTKISTLDMALALENEYDNLQLDISTFDLEIIKTIEKETYDDSNKEIKRAKEAAKLLRNVDKLNKRLRSSYEPSRRKAC
ncbi:hypothetical protein ACJJTC_014618 [Scirpophaga incertulas]